jgi:hypothetical protein
MIQGKVNLPIKLNEHEDIELETNNLLNLLQHSAKEATQNSNPQRTTNNISYEIKRLVTEKRRARSIWQRTHTPDSRRKCRRKSNKLKSKLQEMRNKFFEKYFLILKGKITLFGNRLKVGENPKQHQPQNPKHHPQYANIQHLRDHGQKTKRKKLNYLQKIFPKFSLHITMIKTRKCNKT